MLEKWCGVMTPGSTSACIDEGLRMGASCTSLYKYHEAFVVERKAKVQQCLGP